MCADKFASSLIGHRRPESERDATKEQAIGPFYSTRTRDAKRPAAHVHPAFSLCAPLVGPVPFPLPNSRRSLIHLSIALRSSLPDSTWITRTGDAHARRSGAKREEESAGRDGVSAGSPRPRLGFGPSVLPAQPPRERGRTRRRVRRPARAAYRYLTKPIWLARSRKH